MATARQKRRRTSPEDQTTLEAAFKDNPKPDKAARAELASKVSLSEKEISIWFQNKRQVSRRRSRPLTSHEILSKLPSSQSTAGGLNSSSFSYESSSQGIPSSQDGTTPSTSQPIPNSKVVEVPAKAELPGSTVHAAGNHETTVSEPEVESQQSGSTLPSTITTEATGSQPSATSTSLSDRIPPKSISTKSGTKPSGTSFTLFNDSQTEPRGSASNIPTLTLPTSLKRTLSQPRLSTSLEGSVRVKTGTSPTPSPPRPQSSLNDRQPRPSGPLQRSQSAIVAPTFPAARPHASIGRSRDSRTWEFYCDSGARDELTKQAERESSGSAAGAIGLIRPRSKGSLAAGARISNTNKRISTAVVSKADSTKRLKADNTATSKASSKSKVARASSSVARLQNALGTVKAGHPGINKSTTTNNTGTAPKDEPKAKKSTYYIDTENDGNESDKENWAPGTQIVVSPHRHHHRRANPSNTSSHSKILKENSSIPSHSSSLDALMSRTSSGNGTRRHHSRRGAAKVGKENKPIIDDEVAAFMENGRLEGATAVDDEQVGEGDEEDLDCVQGLLKLREGNWR
ncbi:MAG: hypothetical protein Q9201_001889 [Fulgogasparrea decipioides]